MNENTFWLSIWTVISITFLLMLALTFSYNENKNKILANIKDESCFKLAIVDGSLQSTYATCMQELLIKSK